MKTGALTILRAFGLAAVMATAASARETVFKDDRTLGAPDAPVVVEGGDVMTSFVFHKEGPLHTREKLFVP